MVAVSLSASGMEVFIMEVFIGSVLTDEWLWPWRTLAIVVANRWRISHKERNRLMHALHGNGGRGGKGKGTRRKGKGRGQVPYGAEVAWADYVTGGRWADIGSSDSEGIADAAPAVNWKRLLWSGSSSSSSSSGCSSSSSSSDSSSSSRSSSSGCSECSESDIDDEIDLADDPDDPVIERFCTSDNPARCAPVMTQSSALAPKPVRPYGAGPIWYAQLYWALRRRRYSEFWQASDGGEGNSVFYQTAVLARDFSFQEWILYVFFTMEKFAMWQDDNNEWPRIVQATKVLCSEDAYDACLHVDMVWIGYTGGASNASMAATAIQCQYRQWKAAKRLKQQHSMDTTFYESTVYTIFDDEDGDNAEESEMSDIEALYEESDWRCVVELPSANSSLEVTGIDELQAEPSEGSEERALSGCMGKGKGSEDFILAWERRQRRRPPTHLANGRPPDQL